MVFLLPFVSAPHFSLQALLPSLSCFFLEIKIVDYNRILLENGAIKSSEKSFSFNNKEDAEKALEQIESLLMMEKIIK